MASTIIKYKANPYEGNTQRLMAAKLVGALIKPIKYGKPDSVSGLVHDFLNVGIAAEPSAIIAKMIAIFASFKISHNANAKAEKNPHK